MAAGFRSYVWDPCLIISQIVAVQCVYYLFLAFWVVFVDFSTGNSRSLDQFFSEEDIQFTSSRGKITMVAFCLNTLTGAGGLWVIVRRAKQCLDFAATAHLIHLVNCCIYDGFPSSGSWWMLNLTCMALMAVIGEFVCMRTELKAIPVTVSSVKSSV
ncbi:protein SYS1 homolog [Pocillopora verrucosa]|uniref:protein SYS1 homolog n=1 Tax=Pocillopora damicornis TaxID=46731 RepID=UPI000F556DB9|nr:protein SYS1 homolog [Pocillopora damicornis]XP_058967739.1 protein SYS1 homolog [Pocillopora verrucosa]